MAATAVTQYQDRLEKLLRQPGAINDLMAVCITCFILNSKEMLISWVRFTVVSDYNNTMIRLLN